MLKGNNRNNRKRCEICSKLTPERHHWRRSGVFIVNFEHIFYLFLVFVLLTLIKQMLLRNEKWDYRFVLKDFGSCKFDLTHLRQMLPFYAYWKQETKCFLVFSGGIKSGPGQWPENTWYWCQVNLVISSPFFLLSIFLNENNFKR